MWRSCLLRLVRFLLSSPKTISYNCTAKHFDRDPETNEVLWFASPPLNVAHAPAPKYSLAYLHFLAMKRKAEREGGGTSKRQKVQVSSSVTEISKKVFAEAA